MHRGHLVEELGLHELQARLGDDNIDDLIRLAYGSADFREGMAAFLAKFAKVAILAVAGFGAAIAKFFKRKPSA